MFGNQGFHMLSSSSIDISTRHNVVIIVTRLGTRRPRNSRSISGWDKRFSRLQNFQTGCVISPRVTDEIKNKWLCVPYSPPIYMHGMQEDCLI
jgi:hypothetical protein